MLSSTSSTSELLYARSRKLGRKVAKSEKYYQTIIIIKIFQIKLNAHILNGLNISVFATLRKTFNLYSSNNSIHLAKEKCFLSLD